MVTSALFLGWLLLPSHIPFFGRSKLLSVASIVAMIGFTLVVFLESIRVIQAFSLWKFSSKSVDPIPMTPPAGLRVAVLTTIVPSHEPIPMVTTTLRAMRELRYDGRVDVWILDEENHPEVRRVAAELGVNYFTRHGSPRYNRRRGPFRRRSKAGNHNAWRAEHESDYDVVAQMDPDHVPFPDFLQRTLGYFRDPDMAFVVAPQVYGNIGEGFLAHASAAQAYLFHGVIQRGANGLGAPLLIGTNHLYRTSAWRQIDGYQDSIIEDHLTSLTIHASTNPRTRVPWKGVYTPDILAVGQGPSTWTDYFKQQKRWAYGVWEVVLHHNRRHMPRLRRKQRLSYGLIQSFYPSVATTWTLGNAVTALYLVFGVPSVFLQWPVWLSLWGAAVAAHLCLYRWLRRFNLAEHERREWGIREIVLTLFAGPIYVAAAFSAIFRRRLTYEVTAKGRTSRADGLGTFRLHVVWAVFAALTIGASVLLGYHYSTLRAWALFTFVIVTIPVLLALGRRRSNVVRIDRR